MEWIKPNNNENYLDYINRILQERENKKRLELLLGKTSYYT